MHCAGCEELRAADPIEGDPPYRAGLSVLACLMGESWNRIAEWLSKLAGLGTSAMPVRAEGSGRAWPPRP